MSDRFSGSTLAYQGYGRGLDTAELRRLVDWATAGLAPDLSILVDVPVEVAQRRLAAERPPIGWNASAPPSPSWSATASWPWPRPIRRTGSSWTAPPIATALTARILAIVHERVGEPAGARATRERRRPILRCGGALRRRGGPGAGGRRAARRRRPAGPRLPLPGCGGKRGADGGARASRRRSCVPTAGAGPAGPVGPRWRAATPTSTSSIAPAPC